MSWLLLILYTTALLYLIRKAKFFRLEGLRPWMPAAFFLLKFLAGVALWAIYTYYYTDRSAADIWKYFDDSKVMFGALHDHPADYFKMLTGIGDADPRIDHTYYHTMLHWYQQFDNNLLNDAHVVIRFNAFVRLFSLGNYHIHALFMCFLSFVGLCGIYRTFHPALKKIPLALAASIFLLPSLLFWGSGVMKEGIMLLGLGMVCYHSFRFFADKKWWRLLLIIGSAWLIFLTKFYVLAALIPALAGAAWVRWRGAKAAMKFTLVVVLFAVAGLCVKFVHNEYDPLRVLAWKQNDFVKLARGGTYCYNDSIVAFITSDRREDVVFVADSVCRIRKGAAFMYWRHVPDFSDTLYATNTNDTATYHLLTNFPRAGSFMESDLLQPDLSSFLVHAPQALIRSLLRPYPWEAKNPLLLLPALENLLFLLLLLLVVFFFRRPEIPQLAGFCFVFALLLLLVMGWTTPVLGALVRYRIAAQPFLFCGLLMLIDSDKLLRRFSRRKN